MSTVQLVAEALNNAPEKTLVMADIFKAISDKYQYYQALECVASVDHSKLDLWWKKIFVKYVCK